CLGKIAARQIARGGNVGDRGIAIEICLDEVTGPAQLPGRETAVCPKRRERDIAIGAQHVRMKCERERVGEPGASLSPLLHRGYERPREAVDDRIRTSKRRSTQAVRMAEPAVMSEGIQR